MSGKRNYRDAVEEVRERLGEEFEGENDLDEDSLRDYAHEALVEYVDSAVIYTADVIAYWVESSVDTHDEVDMGSCETVGEAMTQSVYYTLLDDWADAVWDGIDLFLQDACVAQGINLVTIDNSMGDRQGMFDALEALGSEDDADDE